MCFLPEKHEDRREFFRDATRYCVLGFLVMIGAVLVKKAGSAQRCISRGICHGCVAFSDCDLPPAVSLKNAGAQIASKGRAGRIGGI
jgi:hypothetical protein